MFSVILASMVSYTQGVLGCGIWWSWWKPYKESYAGNNNQRYIYPFSHHTNRKIHLKERKLWNYPPPSNSHHQDYYIGNPYKPSLVTVTGWGVNLKETNIRGTHFPRKTHGFMGGPGCWKMAQWLVFLHHRHDGNGEPTTKLRGFSSANWLDILGWATNVKWFPANTATVSHKKVIWHSSENRLGWDHKWGWSIWHPDLPWLFLISQHAHGQ